MLRQQPSWFDEHKGMLALIAVFVAALAFGGWGLWQVLAPASGDPRAQLASSKRENSQLQDELEQLRQQVATLSRSDQISRDANRDVQGALADRDEEIAGLRADVAFYERLVGATAQRRGLSVHALKLQPQNGPAWHFTTTLTQNLNRGAVSDGALTLAIEGTRDGKLQKLAWGDLRQQPGAPGVGYSFKYFQQVEGDVFLPAGMTPVKITVRLQPRSGAAIEQSFSWADATRALASASTGE
jgi:cell division protein FtsB